MSGRSLSCCGLSLLLGLATVQGQQPDSPKEAVVKSTLTFNPPFSNYFSVSRDGSVYGVAGKPAKTIGLVAPGAGKQKMQKLNPTTDYAVYFTTADRKLAGPISENLAPGTLLQGGRKALCSRFAFEGGGTFYRS